MDFFGETSVFDIIVSFVALFTAAFTVYKNFLEGPKLSVVTADSVGLVVFPDRSAKSFNISLNIVNKGSKVGALSHMKVIMLSPDNVEYLFVWDQFFRYKDGGVSLEKQCDPHPITVNPHDSELRNVQFCLTSPEKKFFWIEGKYTFEILGWVNENHNKKDPNSREKFTVSVSASVAEELKKPGEPFVSKKVPIDDWRD